MKRFLLTAIMVIATLSPARAEDGLERASSTEIYLGALFPYHSIGGDIDGERLYANADGASVVPDLDGGLGFGAVVGVKFNGSSGRAIALEASLQGSGHDAEFAGSSGEASFGLLSGDFKFFPRTGGRIEPWFQAGLCAAALEIENGFVSVAGEQKDATYSGGGLNLGLGFLAYLTPRVAFHLAGIYRFINYTEVDYGNRAELDDELNGNTLSIETGITVRFRPG